jgi:competence protein ComEA
MDEGGRSTVVIWLAAAGLAVFAATRLFGGGDGGGGPAPVRMAGGGAPHARAPDLFVHIAGAVRRPGLLRLPADTRVASALRRAGGPTPRADLTAINLAAKVQDGQQIVVPVRGAAALAGASAGSPGAPAGSPSGGATSPGTTIPLSTATVEQLDGIDGIGPTLAGRIIEYRDSHGGFRSLDELGQVDGIGEKRLATLRDALQP